jgi:hypothetical protein
MPNSGPESRLWPLQSADKTSVAIKIECFHSSLPSLKVIPYQRLQNSLIHELTTMFET